MTSSVSESPHCPCPFLLLSFRFGFPVAIFPACMGISLCMIVKNEQDWVAGAVESVRSIVDEVIIVDTGSTDATTERVKRFNPTILSFQWNDSFAAARNASLLEAHEPWILVLDADERIAAKDLSFIVEAVKTDEFAGHHLVQRNYVFGNQVFGWTPNESNYEEGRNYPGFVDNPLIRLFRNSPELRFHGAVHEIIDPNRLPSNLKFGSLPVVLHHYGKVRAEEHVVAKQHMYLSLGLKKVQEDPGNGKAHFDLGIQYQELGRHAEACKCFEQSFEKTSLPVTLLYQAISEKHLRNHESALTLLAKAVKLGLDTFEVHLEAGNVHLAKGNLDRARTEYAVCLKLRPDNPIANFNCGLALRKKGEFSKAESFYQRALALDPQFKEPAIELANLLSADQRHEEAVKLLAPIVERLPEFRDARLNLAKIYIQTNRPERALGLLLTAPANDAIAQCLLGAAYLQSGNLDWAQKHLETALKRDRSLVDARINLAQVFARKGDHARAARYAQSVNSL